MSRLRDIDFSDRGAIEQAIRVAGDGFDISPDLRPRVMDAARVARSSRSGGRHAAVAAAALAAVLLIYAVVGGSLQSRGAGNTADARLEAAMGQVEPARRLSPWALVDAFFAIRAERADAFRADD